MIKRINLILIIVAVALIASCATSMTPFKVSSTLPNLTKSKFLSQAQAEEGINTNKCKYLVKGRKYTAPIGLSAKDDLKKGAKGIDEWVMLDGGNAYVLVSYKWVTIDDKGSTQLYVEFDTLLCN